MLLAVAAAGGAQAAEGTAAHWREHAITFNYFGFTTDYSCDGARDKVRALLQALGAREDFTIRRRGCVQGPGEIEPFVKLELEFATLEPADIEAPSAVPGEYRTVALSYNRPRSFGFGDCELVEQFRDQVFPAFSGQVLDDRVACVPGQNRSWRLALRVLMPPADTGAADL